MAVLRGLVAATCSVMTNAAVALEADETVSNPVIHEIQPMEGVPGDRIYILGKGFGDVAENLSVGVSQPDGRLIVFRVLEASDRTIIAEIGPVPEGAQPGALTVSIGSGTRWSPGVPSARSNRWVSRQVVPESRLAVDPVSGTSSDNAGAGYNAGQPLDPRGNLESSLITLNDPEVQMSGEVAVWQRIGLPRVASSGIFTPRFRGDSTDGEWTVAALRDGRLVLPVDEQWAGGTTLSIHVCFGLASDDSAYEAHLAEVRLPSAETALENARRIADVVEAVLKQRGRVQIECHADALVGAETELILEVPGDGLSSGAMVIRATPAPVVLRGLRFVPGVGSEPGGLRFHFDARAGRRYILQVNDTLRPNGWRDMRHILGNGGPVLIEESSTGVRSGIFRVVAP